MVIAVHPNARGPQSPVDNSVDNGEPMGITYRGKEAVASQAGVVDPEQVTATGGHIQRVQGGTAEGAVGRPVCRHRVGLDDPPRRREDVDQRPGACLPPAPGSDDIAVDIQAHAVQTRCTPRKSLPNSWSTIGSPKESSD